MPIDNVGARLYGRFTKFKPVRKIVDWYTGKNPDGTKKLEEAISKSAIASMAIKDAVGGVMYVTQSLNNEELGDKREFVAALDFVNSGLMIGLQILMFFAMKKINKTLFPRVFDKVFGSMEAATKKRLAAQTRLKVKDIDQNYEAISKATNVKLSKIFKNRKDKAFAMFAFVSELAVATIVGKRILTPLVATPLADAVQKRWKAKKAANAENSVQQNDPKVMYASGDEPNFIDKYKKVNDKDIKEKVLIEA